VRPEVAAAVGWVIFAAALLWPAGWLVVLGLRSLRADPEEAGVAEYLRRQLRG
jgi:hypothetical protein